MSKAHRPATATEMGQKNTSLKHCYDNPDSSSKQKAHSLIDSPSERPHQIISEDLKLGQATDPRSRATCLQNQDGPSDSLDKDQESMEETVPHKRQIIADPRDNFSRFEDQDESSHQERAEMCNHDELALEYSKPQSSHAASSAHHSSTFAARHIPQKQSSSSNMHSKEVIGQTWEFFSSRSSMRSGNQEVPDVAALQKMLEEKDKALDKHSKNYIKLKEEHKEVQERMEKMEEYIRTRETELKGRIQQLIRKCEHTEERFEREVAELVVDLDSARKEYEDLVRKQQEESFKQMSTARWLPADDTSVMIEFGRIKTAMRSWARKNSIKSMASIENLEGPEYRSFLAALSNVAVFENAELPRGLQTPKSPGLVLNAILAHHLCTNIFRSPFFFLEQTRGVESLHQIYGVAQSANEADAHAWRSQTLRMLLPALGANANDGEKSLRARTETAIAQFCEVQASNFMNGAARYLFDFDNNDEEKKQELQAIYQQAGILSYRLWTQRTNLRCFTLQDMGRPNFNADDEYLSPHSLVRYEDHEDQLKGKPITLIVHPLIQAFGTNDGKDYENGRIWACAEVWLDIFQT